MRIVILDRDGVINEDSEDYIKAPNEWFPIKGSLNAIARLNHAGYKVIIATNQSGLARCLFTIDDLNDIHQKMRLELDRVGGQIDGIFFCPHGPEDNCRCRKPKPGLLLDIKERFGIQLNDVPFVGDSLRDVQCAITAGALPFIVRTGKGKSALSRYSNELDHTPAFADLSRFVDHILSH